MTDFTRFTVLFGRLSLCLVLGFGVFSATNVVADDQADEADDEKPAVATAPEKQPLDELTRRGWDLTWRYFAQNFVPFEDDYVGLPRWDSRYSSSTGLTLAAAREKLRESYEVRDGLISVKKFRYAPDEEVEALASALPALELGHYGLLESVLVEEVLGKEEMLVTELRMVDEEGLQDEQEKLKDKARRERIRIDRDQWRMQFQVREELAERQDDAEFGKTMRLVGFSTRGLRAGERYYGFRDRGLNIAVAKREMSGQGKKTRLVLIPSKMFDRSSLSEEQMKDMLARRGWDVPRFVEEVRAARDRDAEAADASIMERLLPPLPEDD